MYRVVLFRSEARIIGEILVEVAKDDLIKWPFVARVSETKICIEYFMLFFFIQFSIPSSINRKNYYSRYLIILVSKFLYSRLLRLFFKVSLRAKGREKNLDSRLESSSIPPFQFASSNKLATSFRIKADYASWLCSSNAKKGWRESFH